MSATFEALLERMQFERRRADALESALGAAMKERDEARERAAKLEHAVKRFAQWREDAHAYDADVGHDPRPFDDDEDWGLMEGYAQSFLNGAAPAPAPEEPATRCKHGTNVDDDICRECLAVDQAPETGR